MEKLSKIFMGLIIVVSISWGQNIIWQEDFDSEVGAGATGSNMTSPNNGKWSVDISACDLSANTDWFKVNNNGVFEARDVDGSQDANGTGNGAIWTSETIDISAYSDITIELDISKDGDLEDKDFIKVKYNLDGSISTICHKYGDFSDKSITASGISGNDLTISVEIDNNAGTEYIRFDNIVVRTTNVMSEPTSHVASFTGSSPSYNQIELSWVDATGEDLPNGYLIKANQTETFSNPTDGNDPTVDSDLSDGSALVKVPYGVENYSFSNLNAETQYYFKIWSYSNSGDSIDFKTDGTVPTDDVTTGSLPPLPNAWINEIHYDNGSTDENEALEIVLENPGDYDLSNFQIDLYNGADGVSYETDYLNSFSIGNSVNGFQYYSQEISGIQNGPDGISLSYNGRLIQFLSYGGTFTADGGPADGVVSTDIGVEESSSTLNSSSLQLTGNGTQYSDFTWGGPMSSTFGAANNGGDQTLPITLSNFSVAYDNNAVVITWTTESEINNLGFNLYKSEQADGNYDKINNKIIEGAGNSSTQTQYTYMDSRVEAGKTYYYQLEDVSFDGKSEKHLPASLTIPQNQAASADKFALFSAYPNPFNPETNISYQLPEKCQVALNIYDLQGTLVKKLVSSVQEQGRHHVVWQGRDNRNQMMPNGLYFYQLTTENGFSETKKIMFLK